MPNYFQLLDKQTKEPVSFNLIDKHICENVLNVPVHTKRYGGDVFNWYDTIGFQIACGKPLGSQELRDHYLKSTLWEDEAPVFSKIIDHLEQNYVSRSWNSWR